MRFRFRFFSLLSALTKPLGLWAGGLYLLGFGLFPFVHHDFLLPFEQFGCVFLGCCFLVWSGISYARLWGVLRSW